MSGFAAGLVILMLAGAAGPLDRDALEETLRAVLADPPADGLLIFEVLTHSKAEATGLRVGDILTHYDGQPVRVHRDLSLLARRASAEGRNRILVIALRPSAGAEIEGEFELAPLGLRFVAVEKGHGRALWRTPTRYDPDFRPIESLLGRGHHWELARREDEPVGWAHCYAARQGPGITVWMHRWMPEAGRTRQQEAAIRFRLDPYLAVRSIRLSADGELLLDLTAGNQGWRGERAGLAVSVPPAGDMVYALLDGLVATTLPRRLGACLRSSYLPLHATTPAPFSDLCCVSVEWVELGGSRVEAHRFERAVFGEPTAQYWIDAQGQVLQTRHDGLVWVRSTQEEVLSIFPDAWQRLAPIEQSALRSQ